MTARLPTSTPDTDSGEKPPACAPLMISTPITSGLIPARRAAGIAAGASRATAAGEKVPMEVSPAAVRKNAQGSSAVRCPNQLSSRATITSTVPLRLATAKK